MLLPIILSETELPGHEGKQVQICGSYGVQDIGGHAIKVKAADGSWKRVRRVAFIKLQDGCVINLENRLNDEMDALDGCRVIATGKLIIPADPPALPIMARPGPVPTLIEIDSIQPQPDKPGA